MRNGLIIYSDGDKVWYKNDLLHRENGPAAEYVNGDKIWWYENKLHRINGPALEFSNGKKYWYYYGEEINCSSQSEFERIIRLKLLW